MEAFLAILQVVLIDLVLAGDNALVIGALAASLDPAMRQKAIAIGVGVAIGTRIFFSLITSWLLLIPAIGVIGGALLLWIAWKLWQDTRETHGLLGDQLNASNEGKAPPRSFAAAIWAILLADVSMSLDNVLGVAAAAHGNLFALIFGLVLSMVLMGTAANWIAGEMQRRPWLIYLGIAAIVLAGLQMIASPLIGGGLM